MPGAKAGETVLIEDDPDVCTHTRDVLSELGYRVIAVGDGASAIEIIDGDQAFELIFTDVVLPGSLNGRDIAVHARTARPNTPILFTSGYAGETIVQNERLEEGVELLSKPFTYDDLASKVRNAIDRSSNALDGAA